MAGGYYSIVRWMKIGFMPCVSGLWTSETYLPAPVAGAPVSLQVGSFSAVEGAARLEEELSSAGFDGFRTAGSGPFRVW